MIAAAVVLAALAGPPPTPLVPPPGEARVHHGRARQLDALPPRLEADAVVDGRLDEAAWAEAVLLTGFSQFAPVDGVAALDSTEVLVWYSPTAIHFGVRAYAAPGTVRATLADRDRIAQDDQVQLFLGTFADSRQAIVLAVNPLGIQSDGVLNETGATSGGGFGRAPVARELPDLAPDFVWRSKGQLTAWGFEVEIAVPFKSIRYQAASKQDWQLNVLRVVQERGHEQVWAPARRANSSFLAQSGRLRGLRDLRRGLVLDLTPTVTERVQGAPAPQAGGWTYAVPGPELGGNVRWGITNNLTLAGTARPDFSDVEADATQFAIDPRSAVFFPERRPFFLEGAEQFATPNGLVYTRRVVQPLGAVKLTGKAAGVDVGFLSALDSREASASGRDNPVYNLLRVQTDVGRQSRVGLLYTDKVDGVAWNRVANADARLVVRQVVSLQLQGALSATHDGATPGTSVAPLWDARLNVDGRALRTRWQFRGVSDAFDTQAGFLSRLGIVRVAGDHRYTFFGRPGALVEAFTPGVYVEGTWRYSDFVARPGRRPGTGRVEEKLHVNTNARLRGGWSVGASVFVENFRYDPDLYANYAFLRPAAGGGVDTVAYTGTPTLPNLDWVLAVSTPQWQRFSLDASVVWGQDENFFEWSSADIVVANATLNLRPTDQLRLAATWNYERYDRVSDGSRVATRHVPRARLEYQLTRTVFFRFIGEYALQGVDSLRDDGRTGLPVVVRNPRSGQWRRALAQRTARLRGDFLFSYFPNPGTVVYAGYGSILRNTDPLGRGGFERTADGFFLKLGYLFRVT